VLKIINEQVGNPASIGILAKAVVEMISELKTEGSS